MLTPTFLPASATKGSYPGKNGLIAFSGMDPTGSDSEIFTMNGDGTGAHIGSTVYPHQAMGAMTCKTKQAPGPVIFEATAKYPKAVGI